MDKNNSREPGTARRLGHRRLGHRRQRGDRRRHQRGRHRQRGARRHRRTGAGLRQQGARRRRQMQGLPHRRPRARCFEMATTVNPAPVNGARPWLTCRGSLPWQIYEIVWFDMRAADRIKNVSTGSQAASLTDHVGVARTHIPCPLLWTFIVCFLRLLLGVVV